MIPLERRVTYTLRCMRASDFMARVARAVTGDSLEALQVAAAVILAEDGAMLGDDIAVRVERTESGGIRIGIAPA